MSKDAEAAASDPIVELRRHIEAARSILITSEPSPDGDGFGAEVGLHHLIADAFGGEKEVILCNERGCPDKFRYFPESALIRPLDDAIRGRTFDVAIVVDAGAERCGAVREPFERAGVRINIDHHKFGSRADYDLAIVDPTAASTTEQVFRIGEHPAWGVPVTAGFAAAIYLGLICDTGSFQFSLTTPETHRIAGKLLAAGIKHDEIAAHILMERSHEEMKMLGRLFLASERSASGRVLHVVIDDPDDIRQPKTTFDRISQELAFVEGVEVTVVVRALPDGSCKLSFRSRGRVDVAALARELDPGGGGHTRAAGCGLPGPARDRVAEVVAAVERKLDALP